MITRTVQRIRGKNGKVGYGVDVLTAIRDYAEQYDGKNITIDGDLKLDEVKQTLVNGEWVDD